LNMPRPETMTALWLENQALQLREDLPVPHPKPGEALIRVRLAGICATDLELVRGYYPFTGVPGHEFVGEVIEASGQPAWQGRRVVGEINLACGECFQCQSGRPRHCERRSVLGIKNTWGAFAEYLILPVENLHTVPPQLADEAAVFTEPLAAALEIQEQIRVGSNDRVLVIGAGRLGQLVAQTLAPTGCELGVVVRHERHKTILQGCGIPTLAESEIESSRWDIVVEVTGNPGGFSLARQAVRPRGTIVLKSTFKGESAANFSAIVVDEITLVGSRCGPFKPALDLLTSQLFDPGQLIDGRYPLHQAINAFHHAEQAGVLKILVDPLRSTSKQP
jgi:threonine dehydrogenase-like Zn-dependent dehydrogenase